MPLPLAREARDFGMRAAIRTFCLGAIVISCSVGLINYNRYLMRPGHFPYAVPIVFFHMVFCSCTSALLYVVAPSLFPALSHPVKRISVDGGFIFKSCMPIAVAFSACLVLNQLAYSMLSVAFLQMIKESNLVIVYAMSVAVGLETFRWQQVGVLAFAVCALFLTIKGEMHFVFVGFLIQFSSVLCEAMRLILQSIALQGQNLDPLSYVLLVAPLCAVLLGATLVVLTFLPAGMAPHGLALPTGEAIAHWWPFVVYSGMLAFSVNVSIATFLKWTSPMSYMFCCIIKDIAAVLIGVIVIHETVSPTQWFAFAMQITAVLLWSLMKTFKEQFEGGIFKGLLWFCRGGDVDFSFSAMASKAAYEKPNVNENIQNEENIINKDGPNSQGTCARMLAGNPPPKQQDDGTQTSSAATV